MFMMMMMVKDENVSVCPFKYCKPKMVTICIYVYISVVYGGALMFL